MGTRRSRAAAAYGLSTRRAPPGIWTLLSGLNERAFFSIPQEDF
jgi:hypothetical protein